MTLLAAAARRTRLAAGGGGGGGHRYWRVRAGIPWLVIELELFSAATAPAYQGGTAISSDLTNGRSANYLQSGSNYGWVGSFAFDDNGNYWNSAGGAGPHWVGVDLGSAQVVRSLNLRAGWHFTGGTISAYLDYSDDGTTWTQAAEIPGVPSNSDVTLTVNNIT